MVRLLSNKASASSHFVVTAATTTTTTALLLILLVSSSEILSSSSVVVDARDFSLRGGNNNNNNKKRFLRRYPTTDEAKKTNENNSRKLAKQEKSSKSTSTTTDSSLDASTKTTPILQLDITAGDDTKTAAFEYPIYSSNNEDVVTYPTLKPRGPTLDDWYDSCQEYAIHVEACKAQKDETTMDFCGLCLQGLTTIVSSASSSSSSSSSFESVMNVNYLPGLQRCASTSCIGCDIDILEPYFECGMIVEGKKKTVTSTSTDTTTASTDNNNIINLDVETKDLHVTVGGEEEEEECMFVCWCLIYSQDFFSGRG